MTDTDYQTWAGHPEGRTWPAFVVAAVLWLPLWPAVAWFGWLLGVVAWLALVAAAGVLWGGWSRIQEGWDRLRDWWLS